jgi:hypothetical protein
LPLEVMIVKEFCDFYTNPCQIAQAREIAAHWNGLAA